MWLFANEEKAAEIGKSARQFVLEKYELNGLLDQNIDFFQSIFEMSK